MLRLKVGMKLFLFFKNRVSFTTSIPFLQFRVMDPLGWNLEHEYFFFFFIEDFLRIDDTIFKFLS